MKKQDQLLAHFLSRSQLGLNLGNAIAAHSAIAKQRSRKMHFLCSAQLGTPQLQIVVHIKQLLKCLILSNLNCLLIELTFMDIVSGQPFTPLGTATPLGDSGKQCGMTPPMNKARGD